MAQVIWTYAAETEFGAIADFIALDNPEAAHRFVQNVIQATRRLERFPRLGSGIPEARDPLFRQLVVSPCRVLYRIGEDRIIIHFIMRSERMFQKEFLS
jgi:toxin ParE1/3/4